jgi:DNA-binding transcriptional LysR family regulator
MSLPPAHRFRRCVSAYRGDFAASILPKIVAEYQARTPRLPGLQLRGDPSENLLRDLRQG